MSKKFDIKSYLRNLIKFRKLQLSKIKPKDDYYDLLMTEDEIKLIHETNHIKQKQMINGYCWEQATGTWEDWETVTDNCDLIPDGNKIDVISRKYKKAMEIKNRWNTMNSSSTTHTLDTLCKFKEKNPEYEIILANIHDKTKEKSQDIIKIHIYNKKEYKYRYLTGKKLLFFIFGKYWEVVLNCMKNLNMNYICKEEYCNTICNTNLCEKHCCEIVFE